MSVPGIGQSAGRLEILFRKLVTQTHVKVNICLLIDGLDEFAGDKDELVDLFVKVPIMDNVKICLSSRL
jgi:hypothetical protein